MTTHEYLQKLGIKPDSEIQLAFMVGEVQEVTHSYKRMVYHSTPVWCVRSWYNIDRVNPEERVRNKVLDYVILNTEVHDLNWMSGANWNIAIDNHRMMMLLVVSREELEKYYCPKQALDTEDYITKRIIDDINEGRNPWVEKQ